MSTASDIIKNAQAKQETLKQETLKQNTLANYPNLLESLLRSNLFCRQPARVVAPLSWVEHIPFAFFLTEILKPKIVVELGVHTGNSFNAWCQAVDTLALDSKIYGVDSWQGDPHAGTYGGGHILASLDAYVRQRYPAFANLMKMYFDEALEYFSDGSIDLLHIDGFHTYEAARNDFDRWLPKMSSRGVVLLHDTSLRRDEFGVWKLLEELHHHYPCTEFNYGFGLGVVSVGSNPIPTVLELIAANREISTLRDIFGTIGKGIRLEAASIATQHEKQQLQQQLQQQSSELQDLRTRSTIPKFSLLSQAQTVGQFSLQTSATNATYFECLFSETQELSSINIASDQQGLFKHSGIELLGSQGELLPIISVQAVLPKDNSAFFCRAGTTFLTLQLDGKYLVQGIRGYANFFELADKEIFANAIEFNTIVRKLEEYEQNDQLKILLELGNQRLLALLGNISYLQNQLAEHEQTLKHATQLEGQLITSSSDLASRHSELLKLLNNSLKHQNVQTERINQLEQDRLRSKLEAITEETVTALQNQQRLQLRSLEEALASKDKILQDLLQSRSWKLTAPLRRLLSLGRRTRENRL